MPTLLLATQMCQLSFHLRIHGKATDKSVTIGKEVGHQNHLLTPLGGVTGLQEPHQTLLLLLKAHPAEYAVDYTGTLNERHFYEAARKYVTTNLAGYDVSSAVGLPSKWNPNYNRWDPPSAGELAYGYVITNATTAGPIESFCTAGVQTLFVDFIIHLQKNAP